MREWFHRFGLVNAIAGLAEKVSRWWPAMTTAIASLISGWTTAITDTFQQYAPASWLFGGLIGGVLFAAFLWLVSAARLRLARIRYYNAAQNPPPQQINPLNNSFDGLRINCKDLADPVNKRIENKTFTGCEITGPEIAYFSGCNFHSPMKLDANDYFVILDQTPASPANGVLFFGCIFRNCRFVRLTMLFNEATASRFDELVKTPIPWMTYRPHHEDDNGAR